MVYGSLRLFLSLYLSQLVILGCQSVNVSVDLGSVIIINPVNSWLKTQGWCVKWWGRELISLLIAVGWCRAATISQLLIRKLGIRFWLWEIVESVFFLVFFFLQFLNMYNYHENEQIKQIKWKEWLVASVIMRHLSLLEDCPLSQQAFFFLSWWTQCKISVRIFKVRLFCVVRCSLHPSLHRWWSAQPVNTFWPLL